jgi:hypothetical protein
MPGEFIRELQPTKIPYVKYKLRPFVRLVFRRYLSMIGESSRAHSFFTTARYLLVCLIYAGAIPT